MTGKAFFAVEDAESFVAAGDTPNFIRETEFAAAQHPTPAHQQ
jgi:hypothetical protein